MTQRDIFNPEGPPLTKEEVFFDVLEKMGVFVEPAADDMMADCVEKALFVRSCMGGKILEFELANGEVHYKNLLPDGKVVDVSSGRWQKIKEGGLGKEVSPNELLARGETIQNSHLRLLDRFNTYLKELYPEYGAPFGLDDEPANDG